MGKIEFLMAFVSIIIALGVTDLLYSIHRLIRVHKQIKWHWLSIAWGIHVLLLLVNSWYGVTASFEHPIVDTSIGFIFSQIPVFLVLLMALAVLPDHTPEEGFDMKEWYFSQSTYFFTLHALFGISLSGLALVMGASVIGAIPFMVLAAMLLSMALIKKYQYHFFITILILISDLVFLSSQTLRVG